MSEPKTKARSVKEVLPELFHWSVKDDRIDGHPSDAYAIRDAGRLILIDPLPIDPEHLRELGEVEAIVLTAGNHQRAAWRLRRELKAPVVAPENAYGLEDKPDMTYAGGMSLPGQLVAFHTPGPVASMHALWLARPHSIVFLSDLLMHDGQGTLHFVPDEYQDEPARTRASVQRVMEKLTPQTLCFAHGPPLLESVREAVARVLKEEPAASEALQP